MDKDCEKRLSQIVQGFSECKDAFTAIGDETRQLILMVLLESDLSGIRVGEIARKTHLTCLPPSENIKGGRHCGHEKRRNKKLLLYQSG